MSYFGGIILFYVSKSYPSMMNESHLPIFDVVCVCMCVCVCGGGGALAGRRSCGKLKLTFLGGELALHAFMLIDEKFHC